MCRVAYVCRQASSGNAGQISVVSVVLFIGLLRHVNVSDGAREARKVRQKTEFSVSTIAPRRLLQSSEDIRPQPVHAMTSFTPGGRLAGPFKEFEADAIQRKHCSTLHTSLPYAKWPMSFVL
jgi:hypothetical protein